MSAGGWGLKIWYCKPKVTHSYNFVQNCRIRDARCGSIQFVEAHQIIPSRHGYENSESS
uniref:Uncharacterized protein n=1 Tax=Meloidogyne incognita TaxID=6306 RepID=A0A914MHS8_MELIC